MLNGEFQISVNKSPVQFRSEPTAGCLLTDMMGEAGLSWDSIIVEITEGVLMEKIPLVQQKLLEFEAKGVAVALDDFGTGYSSLSYLKKFDIDYLKIDRIFIQEVTTDKGDQVLCEAIIAMAHKLGIKVIAEGVETKEQMEYLKAIECDYVQGFYISRPIPPEEFERLYKSGFGMAAQTH